LCVIHDFVLLSGALLTRFGRKASEWPTSPAALATPAGPVCACHPLPGPRL
jgi:hypothetical protein